MPKGLAQRTRNRFEITCAGHLRLQRFDSRSSNVCSSARRRRPRCSRTPARGSRSAVQQIA